MTLKIALVVARVGAQMALKFRQYPGTLVLDVSLERHFVHVALVASLTRVQRRFRQAGTL
jgi:multisubunit Na+/H+ antiporter MnhE subunit